ncbi:hypothetical protein [Allochromatium warmingii]|nr:hypothetical protein [Allochromatium warmingii]
MLDSRRCRFGNAARPASTALGVDLGSDLDQNSRPDISGGPF